ncbi:hypothetical protein Tco_0966441 [Tanacetum coccineum]
MGELTFFLGLQVKQKDNGIFISQDKYVADILKRFDFSSVKTASTLLETNKALIKDEEAEDVDVTAGSSRFVLALQTVSIGCVTFLLVVYHGYDILDKLDRGSNIMLVQGSKDSPFDLEAFSDSDYARASLDRKSTTGGCQFLGKRLISWQCKKQTIVANSTTEAEYVAAANCCGQNPVFYSKTKHIEIRHHFIRDCYEKKLIQVIKIHTDHNVADLLTKAFDVSREKLSFISSGTSLYHFRLYALTVSCGHFKSAVRSDLLFNDETMEQMRLSIRRGDSVERAVTTTASLVAAQDRRRLVRCRPSTRIIHGRGADAQTRHETASKMSRDPPLSKVNTSRRGEDSMEYHDDLTDFVPPTPHDSPLSGGNTPGSDEGRMELIQELMETCTSLTKRVLSLEERKTAQDKVITRLKLRVKSLEKKRKAKTPQPMKRILFKGKVETSIDTKVIMEDKGSGEKDSSTSDQVSTSRPKVSAASVPGNVSAATPSTPPTTTTIFGDEYLTIAQKLMKMRSEKAKEKEKGVVLIDEKEPPRLNRSTTTLQPLPTIDPNRQSDADLAQRLHEEELAELDRAQKERQKEKKLIDDFKPIDDDSQQQAESTKKRPKADSEEESSKKQKLEEDNDAEKEELRDSMDVVPKDDVAIDVESLATKYPIIFGEMLDDFDRQDVIDLHRLVNERYETTSPEGYDWLLWGDLNTLFEPNKEMKYGESTDFIDKFGRIV